MKTMTLSLAIDNDVDGYGDHKGKKFRLGPKQILIIPIIAKVLVLVRIQSGVKKH